MRTYTSRETLAGAWPWGWALALMLFSAWACLASWRMVRSDAPAARPAPVALAGGAGGVRSPRLAL